MSPKFVLDLSNDTFFRNISQFSLLKLFNNDYFFDISIAYIHRKINSFMKIVSFSYFIYPKNIIITKSISRFARNTVDCLNYIRKLKEKKIAVFFEKENINTLDSKGETLLTIMNSSYSNR